MQKIIQTVLCCVLVGQLWAQPDRWQQRIKYSMDVKLDVKTHIINGTQKIEYINNSPDTLQKIYFHLYWNAFQPNSNMDVRSRELGKTILRGRGGLEIPDWDARVKDRISKLSKEQIGYQSVKKITINGVQQKTREWETILEVQLTKPILPKSSTLIDLIFEAQVPIQIRRSGRDNAEGVRYSMSQWYPKMVEYDYQGWNANQYIAREFYGVWGDYDVKITLDKNYMIAATGVLQNPNTIGFGYENPGTKVAPSSSATLTWNFKGENIHDFVWAADDTYKHISKNIRKGLTIHAFYKAGNSKADSAWNNVLWCAERVLPYMESRFGKYPYPQYSFIQGGDGGMEYAMATLLKNSSLGTVIHEWMHSWYQHMLGTNESLFGWMDEGFTSYATDEVSYYYNKNWAPTSPYTNDIEKTNAAKAVDNDNTRLPKRQNGNYESYYSLARSGFEEPASTHADHFNTNYAYSTAAYSKGATLVSVLGYIVGDSIRDNILLEYYKQWRFKHPNANDFFRVAEKVSGLHLQWLKEYWIYSTKTCDYAIGDMATLNNQTQITIKRIGKMPMPVEVLLTFKDGSTEHHYIPLNLLLGEKVRETKANNWIVSKDWAWTHPEYQLVTKRDLKDIKSIEIDPSYRMPDINKQNNKVVIPD